MAIMRNFLKRLFSGRSRRDRPRLVQSQCSVFGKSGSPGRQKQSSKPSRAIHTVTPIVFNALPPLVACSMIDTAPMLRKRYRGSSSSMAPEYGCCSASVTAHTVVLRCLKEQVRHSRRYSAPSQSVGDVRVLLLHAKSG